MTITISSITYHYLLSGTRAISMISTFTAFIGYSLSFRCRRIPFPICSFIVCVVCQSVFFSFHKLVVGLSVFKRMLCIETNAFIMKFRLLIQLRHRYPIEQRRQE
ncbi:hypothetical protein BC835DRAFT_1341818 [Cytidiella melzeri]|nr:hypothetical protein BC835DRAFT_1341818 [Cytidiella melzeri]